MKRNEESAERAFEQNILAMEWDSLGMPVLGVIPHTEMPGAFDGHPRRRRQRGRKGNANEGRE